MPADCGNARVCSVLYLDVILIMLHLFPNFNSVLGVLLTVNIFLNISSHSVDEGIDF